MSVGRVVGVTLGVGIVIAAVGYAGASWLLFDAASKVEADCGTDDAGLPRFAAYTPASFGTAGVSEDSLAEGFDTAAYAMPVYEEVQFQSRDGVDLVAWWVPGPTADAPAVVVVHGKGSCRRDPVVLLPAGMLNRYGFAVLIIDVRDMGGSEVIDGRYSGGTQEYPDALGAWDWLRERGLPAASIGLLGESNGAATVVIAAGEEPAIAATWEDSGYSDTTTVIREEVRYQGFPEILTEGAVLWARVFGIDLDSKRPIDAIAKLGDRPLQVVHGTSDDRVQPHHALDFVRAREEVVGKGGQGVEPWFITGGEHVEGSFLVPDEYERRLVAFFTDALGTPEQP
jgi:dipeptidyl aminopeptidase/acylaminoacyl peptidase